MRTNFDVRRQTCTSIHEFNINKDTKLIANEDNILDNVVTKKWSYFLELPPLVSPLVAMSSK